MKKCPGCHREIDKYGLACQYCGKVQEARDKEKKEDKKRKVGKDDKSET